MDKIDQEIRELVVNSAAEARRKGAPLIYAPAPAKQAEGRVRRLGNVAVGQVFRFQGGPFDGSTLAVGSLQGLMPQFQPAIKGKMPMMRNVMYALGSDGVARFQGATRWLSADPYRTDRKDRTRITETASRAMNAASGAAGALNL